MENNRFGFQRNSYYLCALHRTDDGSHYTAHSQSCIYNFILYETNLEYDQYFNFNI